MRRICTLLVVLLLFGYSVRSAGLPTLDDSGAAAIDRMFQAAVDKGEIPGVVAAVTNKDQIIYLKAFGKQNVGQNIPMSTDTVFRIASMTKPVTSVGVMMLYEQGKLKLDDAAGNYVPAFKGRQVIASFNEKDATYTTRPAKREVTIRHLLTHTSGLGYPFTSPTVLGIQQKAGTAPVDMPLLFDPGTKWQYSASTAVLGTIVEKLGGQPIEEFDQTKIFRPLGMVDTSYYLPQDKAGRLATVHQREATGLVENPNPATYTPSVRGDGGLLSTASDYTAFVQMFLNEGSWHGTRLLKPESVRLMTSNQIGSVVVETMPAAIPRQSDVFPFGAGKDKFGLGFQITVTDGARTHERGAGSYTWAGIDNTHFWVDPKNGIGVVILTQVLPFYNPTSMDVMKRFEKLIYEHLGTASSARAEEVTLVAPGGIRAAIEKMIPDFEKKTGHKVKATFGSGGGTKQQVVRGEPFDVPIVQPPYPDVLASGNVVASSETPLATVAVAVAVRKGAPKPDISTPEAVKRMLLAAKAVAYPNPSGGAAAGVSFDKTLEKLGIADQMKPKIKLAQGGAGAMAMLAKGEVDIGLTFLSEMEDPGVDAVGPLPREISTPTGLVGFVSTHAKAPEAAKALLRYLSSSDAARVYKASGMQPGR